MPVRRKVAKTAVRKVASAVRSKKTGVKKATQAMGRKKTGPRKTGSTFGRRAKKVGGAIKDQAKQTARSAPRDLAIGLGAAGVTAAGLHGARKMRGKKKPRRRARR